MKEKLTLSIDKSVIERSKKVAKKNRTSISSMVESYLEQANEDSEDWKPEKGSITEKLFGAIKIDTNDPWKKVISDARAEKNNR